MDLRLMTTTWLGIGILLSEFALVDVELDRREPGWKDS